MLETRAYDNCVEKENFQEIRKCKSASVILTLPPLLRLWRTRRPERGTAFRESEDPRWRSDSAGVSSEKHHWKQIGMPVRQSFQIPYDAILGVFMITQKFVTVTFFQAIVLKSVTYHPGLFVNYLAGS
ncbi:MAG: hypothetical protein JWM68_5756 [Verrucomicrobiales bacterium]|nr:hypothetical protein [Verrucomicrobiales bacterium]